MHLRSGNKRDLNVFFVMFSVSALAHDGVVKAGPEGVGKLVNLVITIDLNGLLGRVEDHMAFVAPMQVLIKFSLEVLCDLAVQVIRQFL
jgi:hypothetical protein